MQEVNTIRSKGERRIIGLLVERERQTAQLRIERSFSQRVFAQLQREELCGELFLEIIDAGKVRLPFRLFRNAHQLHIVFPLLSAQTNRVSRRRKHQKLVVAFDAACTATFPHARELVNAFVVTIKREHHTLVFRYGISSRRHLVRVVVASHRSVTVGKLHQDAISGSRVVFTGIVAQQPPVRRRFQCFLSCLNRIFNAINGRCREDIRVFV